MYNQQLLGGPTFATDDNFPSNGFHDNANNDFNGNMNMQMNLHDNNLVLDNGNNFHGNVDYFCSNDNQMSPRESPQMGECAQNSPQMGNYVENITQMRNSPMLADYPANNSPQINHLTGNSPVIDNFVRDSPALGNVSREPTPASIFVGNSPNNYGNSPTMKIYDSAKNISRDENYLDNFNFQTNSNFLPLTSSVLDTQKNDVAKTTNPFSFSSEKSAFSAVVQKPQNEFATVVDPQKDIFSSDNSNNIQLFAENYQYLNNDNIFSNYDVTKMLTSSGDQLVELNDSGISSPGSNDDVTTSPPRAVTSQTQDDNFNNVNQKVTV